MSDPNGLRVNVTWGDDQTQEDRLRSILQTFGLVEVARDDVGSLFAPPAPRAPAEPRRVSVRG